MNNWVVIKTGGKQYKVAEGDQVVVEKVNIKEDSPILFDEVLLVVDEGKLTIGTPFVNKVKVRGKVLSTFKDKKVRVVKNTKLSALLDGGHNMGMVVLTQAMNMGIKKVVVAEPGFVNFYLADDYFIEEIKKINENYGKIKKPLFGAKKVIIEYTDPNPFKLFHIGHLMSNAIGESIARIFEFQGAKVKRANYFGDVGLHVAKAIYGKMKNSLYSWQDSYVFGAKAYQEDESSKKQIEELNKKIYEKSDKQVNTLYAQGKKESLLNFEKIYLKDLLLLF